MLTSLSLVRPDIVLNGDQQGSGRSVLLLHAGGERRKVWYPVMETLSTHGFHTVAYDQRAHGESGGSPDEPVTLFADDAVAMIKEMVMPAVVGASLGGFALMLALADPDVQSSVSALVLVDVLPDPDPDIVRGYLSRGERNMSELPLVSDILSRREELCEAASSLKLPVLLVRGEKSDALMDSDTDRFRKLVPHVEEIIIPDAGHLVARDQPDLLANEVTRFLDQDLIHKRSICG